MLLIALIVGVVPISSSFAADGDIPVTGISMDQDTLDIVVGDTGTLAVVFDPEDATNQNVTWSSSDESVATVDETGEVAGMDVGTATITAVSEDGGFEATAEVTVSEDTGVVDPTDPGTELGFDELTMDLPLGETADLTEIATIPDGVNVTWSSSDENVVSVDESGVITASQVGEADITMDTGEVQTEDGPPTTATITITVTIPVEGVELDKSELTVGTDETGQLTATVLPTNATNQDVYWESDDEDIATVDENGLVTGVTAGESTIITVYTDEGGFEASATVTVADNVPVTGVKFDKSTLTLNEKETAKLTPTVSPSNATNKNVTYTSSDIKVATVDAAGTVKAIAAGKATITVTTVDAGKTAKCDVTVKAPVTGVKFDKTTLALNEKETAKLTATLSPANATVKDVTYSSSDIKVATVDASGTVKAVSAGKATITVTTVDGGKTAKCDVTVKAPVTGVSLDKSTLTLNEKETAKLTATLSPANATVKDVTYSSSDIKVATVDASGTVKAVSAGKATITVTTVDGGKTAKCDVTVKAPVTGVSLDKSTLTLNEKETTKLTATLSPSNATNKNVTYTSSDIKVATVDASGTVKAVSAGKATITVTTVDGGKTAKCDVTVKAPVTGVSLDKSTLTLNDKETAKLTATLAPANATNKDVTYATSDKSVVTVDATGTVKAIAAGKATITVTTVDGGKTAKCDVTVVGPVIVSTVTLAPTSIELKVGQSKQLAAPVIKPENATNKNVVWTSTNPTVAQVDANGNIKTLAAGTTKITATSVSNSKAAGSVTVNVVQPVTGVKVSKESASIKIKGTIELKAIITPTNATNSDVSWKSSNTKFATVDDNGKVTGVKAGTVTITVTTDDGGYTATCTITIK
jgi:uncharacterized protein YjdB